MEIWEQAAETIQDLIEYYSDVEKFYSVDLENDFNSYMKEIFKEVKEEVYRRRGE